MDYSELGKIPDINLAGALDWQKTLGIHDQLKFDIAHQIAGIHNAELVDMAKRFQDHVFPQPPLPNITNALEITNSVADVAQETLRLFEQDHERRIREFTQAQSIFSHFAEAPWAASENQKLINDSLLGIEQERQRIFLDAQQQLHQAMWSTAPPIDFHRFLLPPNLRDHHEEVTPAEVLEFVEEEAIPLYLVPRGTTAVTLVQAQTRSERRNILGRRYTSIITDCAEVLESCDHEIIASEVSFTQEALEVMRAGYSKTAQGMLTVLLDTLVGSFWDRQKRSSIIVRRKEQEAPELLAAMNVRQSLVWFPVWNAHEVFQRDEGDPGPRYYNRHASVHAVSPRQFNKRNCIQALMLVTSLLGYANRLARYRGTKSTD